MTDALSHTTGSLDPRVRREAGEGGGRSKDEGEGEGCRKEIRPLGAVYEWFSVH